MDDNIDISSLDLKDSYDIYKTLIDNSVTLDKEIQKSCIPMELFNLEEKEICFNGLLTPKRKDELLYYALLIKMMNITEVKITYNYASNIPIEYICPSCIKDIFHSLEKLEINVTTHYNKTELLLNPNSDEYIMEYIRLFNEYDYEIINPEEYEYYTESEMNEYNKISSSLDRNKLYYSHNLIDTVAKRRENYQLPKLYKYVVNEAIYTNDYSQVRINKTEDEYTLDDEVRIEYDEKTNDKTFIIDKVYTKHCISQLLLLPSYLCISKIIFDEYLYHQIDPMLFMKLFEGVIDSLTTLNIELIKELTNEIDENLFNKIMTTHVFPNVTELICDDTTDNFDSLFPASLISMIDTIRINYVDDNEKEEIVLRLDEIVYTHSIHIDINGLNMFYSSRSANINLFESIENNNQNIDSLKIKFEDDEDNEDDVRNALERFLNTDILKHLNNLDVSFDKNISMEYLTWISTLFNDNTFNIIHKLEIDLYSMEEDSSSEYLTAFENILEKFISKASIVKIEYSTISFINRLIPKGCFHNTTQLILKINDILDDNFCKLYTTDNFPQLKSIKFHQYCNGEWWSSFIDTLCRYINNSDFPSSSIVRLSFCEDDNYDDYIYDPNNSILRYKYDSNSFINTIIGTYDKMMSKYEIETLFDCINENKTQNIKSLALYIYDEEQLPKLINFINTGKIPKLKTLNFRLDYDIYEQKDIYKQQLNDSSFIQENHVNYKFG
ncbi:hypothetical protein WA158_006627 [Blastocystis sp. Blastoise]